MSRRSQLLSLALLLPLAAFAQQVELPKAPPPSALAPDLVPAPPRFTPDTSPTHHACTTGKLLHDEPCSFEFESPKVSGDNLAFDNQRRATKLAAGCANAATAPGDLKPDGTLLKQCEADLAESAVASCGLGGSAALEDANGRWSTAARDCAASLQAALAKTRTQAVVSLRCCRCLAAAKCPVAAPACLSQLHDNKPSNELTGCVRKAGCADTCSVLRDFSEPPPQEQPPAPRRREGKKSTDAVYQRLYF